MYFDNLLFSYLYLIEFDVFLRIYFNYFNEIKGKKIFKILKNKYFKCFVFV